MTVSGHLGSFWRSARSLPDRTPLRVKLISAVLGLVAVALVVISLASVSVIKSYLLGNVDQQLSQLYNEARANQNLGPAAEGPVAPPEKFVVEAIIDGRTQALRDQQFLSSAGPRVPNTDAWLAAHAGTPTTVAAISGDTRWRVVAYLGRNFIQFNGLSGRVNTVPGTLVVGIDVTSTYHTIDRLAFFDFIISLILLVAIALAGIAVVRASLRPLTEIEKTAGAIAAGDITRRVPERHGGTEVGRLGRSLNVMLSQIEAAFRARAESERAARRSEERMRQFVADASHELRTPLTAIRGFAEYYRQRGGIGGPQQPGGNGAGPATVSGTPGAGQESRPVAQPPAELARGASAEAGPAGGEALASTDMDRIMRRVEQESARMGVLVEDMLLLARLDQQRPLDLRTVDLLTLAADAVHDARVVAPDRSIDLEVGSRAALLVTGDEVRLRQVISNLMSNALVHTPPSTPIEVRLRTGSLAEAQAAAASRAAGRAAGGETQAATSVDWSAAGETAGRPAAGGYVAPDGTITGNEHSPAGQAASAGPAAGESQQAWGATPLSETASRGEAAVARATSAAHGATAVGATGLTGAGASGARPGSAVTPAAPEAGPLAASSSSAALGRAGTAWPAAVLEVADLGPGLSPEQSEHVFERFYRADQARTSGGSGLGLAIVSALVTAHGGAVWVDSRPGQGATFSIALPLAPEVVGHEPEHDELDPPADEQAGPAATGDDEPPGQRAFTADQQSETDAGWPPSDGLERRQEPKLDFTQPEVIELRRGEEPPG